MTNSTALATKVQEMVVSGMTLEEALASVLADITPSSSTGAKRDNIAYIKGLRDIPEVKRCRKIGYAKISKSKGKEEAIARYRVEIATADEILNGLLEEVNSAEIPWMKAMELGESAASAFNYYLQPLTEQLEEKVLERSKTMTKAQVKAELLTIKPSVPKDSPKVFEEVWKTRIANQDMMVITLARKVAFVNKKSK